MADNKDQNNSEVIDMDVEVPNVLRKSELDINKNLGKFGQSKAKVEVDVQTVAIVEEVEQKAKEDSNKIEEVKINFNKFSTIKTSTDTLTSRIQVRMQSILNSKKGLILTWVTIAIILGVLIATQVCYIHFGADFLTSKHGHVGTPIKSYIECWKVGNIFSYISLCLPAIPLFALLICWLVGINGTISSVKFHSFLWITLIISLCLMLIATILFATYVGESNAFTHPV